MTLGRTARAKLNLALHVTGQRAVGTPQAGYHTLHSLIAFADFGDSLQVLPADQDRLSIAGPFAADVPALGENSLGKALAMVRGWGQDDLARHPVSLKLIKQLPVASGIGGGSADAAALIAALTGARALTASQRADVLTLGADVPMCLAGRAAMISGIGEAITPVNLPGCALVLVNPGVGVETPGVFRALTEKTNPPLPVWSAPADFDGLIAYLQATRNDLMAPAISIAPIIQDCLDTLKDAPFARMSGSGATCFALFETFGQAEEMAARTQKAHPDWWVRAGMIANT